MRNSNVLISFIICFAIICHDDVQSLGIPGRRKFDYDLVVIGAGASGMFAAGTAAGFGRKTLLIDKHDLENDADFYIGGDCTNAACVPSKAIRCAAKVAGLTEQASLMAPIPPLFDQDSRGSVFSSAARKHAKKTTNIVRARESPERIASSPNLDIIYTPRVAFQNSKRLMLKTPFLFNSTFSGYMSDDNDKDEDNASNSFEISAKKFIICTGAGPSIPPTLQKSAKKVGVEILTYRSIFQPDGTGKKSDYLWNLKPTLGEMKRVVIVGGGSTACEIAQSLARLNKYIDITIIAPTILGSEDVAARAAARKILFQDGVNIINRRRVLKVSRFAQKKVLELDDETRVPVDVLICATGRDPGQNLNDMQLEKAGIKWSHEDGIIVDSKLRSVSSKHVFAAGDCASAVPNSDRRASHAGWTGYHAVQTALLPRFLLPSDSVHPAVPRVTFTDPEIASIGLNRAECIQTYGSGGFQYLKASENNTDRADIDSIARNSDGFVELRVSIPQGKILGATICSPAASEIVNELGVAIVNKLTVRDIAKCIHTYPSYGYLMHRVALSLAMSDIWGVLAACGPVGKAVGWMGRNVSGRSKKGFRSRKGKRRKQLNNWKAIGAQKEFDYHISESSNDYDSIGSDGILEGMKPISSVCFLEASQDKDLCDVVRRHTKDDSVRKSEKEVLIDFIKWLDSKPK